MVPWLGIAIALNPVMANAKVNAGSKIVTPPLTISLTQVEKTFLEKHPVIRVSNEMDWPPYDFNENGEAKGYCIDLLNLMADIIGVRFEYIHGYSWKELVSLAREKKIDVIHPMKQTPERDQFLNFTDDFIEVYNVFVIPKDAPAITNTEQLFGKILAVINGYSYHDSFRKRYPRIKIIEVENPLKGLLAVSGGMADAFFETQGVVSHLIQKHFISNLKIGGILTEDKDTQNVFKIGVRKDWPILRDILQKTFRSLSIDQINLLKNRWFQVKTIEPAVMLTAQEQQMVQETGEITVASLHDFVPFSFTENGESLGLSRTLLDLIGQKTGLSFKYLMNDWSTNLADFKGGRVDMIESISHQSEREAFTLFTDPYYKISNVYYIRKEVKNFDGVNSLKGKRVALQKDIFYEEEFRALEGNMQVIEFGDYGLMIKALSYGKVDVAVLNLSSGNYFIRKNGLTNLKIGGEFNLPSVKLEDLCFGVQKTKPLLYSVISKGLAAITRKEMDQALDRWLWIGKSNDDQFNQSRTPNLKLSQSEKQFLATGPVLKVSSEIDRPPFDFTVGGQPQGISIDLLDRISAMTGLQIQYINGYTWPELIDLFEKGELDLLHSIFMTEKRLKAGQFTRAYYMGKQKYIIHKENPDIQYIQELFGRVVAIPKGWAMGEYLDKFYPQVRQLIVPDMATAFEMVRSHKADATIELAATAYYHLQKNFIDDLKLSGSFNDYNHSPPNTLRFLVQNDMPELHQIIEKALAAIPPGDMEQLIDKWLGIQHNQQTSHLGKVIFTPEEHNYLTQKKGRITYCIDPAWAPFEYIDDKGRHQGITRSYVDLFENLSDIDFVFRPTTTWAHTIESAKNRDCDCIMQAGPTVERKKFLDFTSPILDFPQVVVTTGEKPFINELSEISDKRLGVTQGYAIVDLLRIKYPGMTLVTFPNITKGLEAVHRNSIYGFIDFLPSATHGIGEIAYADLKISGKIEEKIVMGFATRNDEPLLGRILQKMVSTLSEVENKRIQDSWMTIRFEQGFDYGFLWKLIPLVAIILAGILIWNRSLIKEIKKRKAVEKKLRVARHQALEANKAKGEFLANMSHEIRTPMNGVISATELAMSEEKSPEMENYLKIIHNSGYSLLGVINDILDFSKIEAGLLELEDLDFHLSDTLNRVTDIFVKKAAEKNIELMVDLEPGIPMALIGDTLRLQQAITNLVGNAIKFTPEGGMVIIGVASEKRSPAPDKTQLHFYVQDTGIGIKEDYLKRLFTPFTQAESSTTRKFGGTGLGLSITKQLVDMMGGRIWVDSTIDLGTTFHFNAVFLKQPVEPDPKTVIPDDMKNLNVMVVDDRPESRHIAQKLISSLGFKVTPVGSGAEAMDRIRHAEPCDLILMDCQMPEQNGIETAASIRESLKKQMPIILMLDFGDVKHRMAAEKAGINRCIDKPLDASSLFDTIMDVFGKINIRRKNVRDAYISKAEKYKELLGGARVLLAEDNLTNQEIAKQILKRAGVDLTIVNNGKEAVKAVADDSYEVVLMDIQMPELDGYEATRLIREEPRFQTLPIIAMTAHAMKGDEQKCLDAGMDGYVSKPINQQRLFQVLAKHVAQYRGDHNPEWFENKTLTIAPLPPGGSLPGTLPGLDIKNALANLQIEAGVFKDVLLVFSRNNQHRASEMAHAFESMEWTLLGQLAHSLKGSGANIGAIRLQSLSHDLEIACSKSAGNPMEKLLLENTIEALSEVLNSIAGLAPAPAAPGGETNAVSPMDPEVVGPVIKALHDAINSSEPNVINPLVRQLEKACNHDLVKEIESKTAIYEYEDARIKVIELMQLLKGG
jgi:ABC-type amino acid transport substrate-binding protein/CheY-like chemotaxis protein/nitrogen-specific signal transduction histidine kinase/HPt (histidine-containing phosphotransfer) domain-containing protein